MIKSAYISDCKKYRYTLERIWGEGPVVAFCMLNPSTADASKNDPTVERCERRAKSMGYGGMYVINLFALRSTDPNALYSHNEPIGEENDMHIRMVIKDSDAIICGWGKHGTLNNRGLQVLNLIKEVGKTPLALKINKDGTPAHPLYIGYSILPKPML